MRSFITSCLVLVGCSAGGNAPLDGGTVQDGPTADVGGGSISELRFAVVGDTRPASPDDTTHYPTAIITKIWQDVQAESPRPQFAISTGDYIFASTNKSEQNAQFDLYIAARAAFTGLQYPALGNHECTGATDSNCGAGATDGVTKNYTAFMQKMLAPLGITTPYYVEHFTAADSSWTAKFVFIACNAWNATQSSWLDTALAEQTTYTFVVRHEDSGATTAPCVTPSGTIIAKHPVTLNVRGHTHTYRHYATEHEIVVGNGGAPLTTGMNYGYVIVARNASGSLTVTAYDYATHAVLDTFSISATGAAL